MGRPRQNILGAAALHRHAAIHDQHALAILGDDRQIVAHQNQRHVGLRAKFRDEIEDLRLHGDIERRGRLVGDEQPRLAD